MTKARGAGSVQQHGAGNWRIWASAGVEGEHRRRISRVVSGSRSHAERALREWLADLDAGAVSMSALTVGEAVDRQADEQARRGLAVKTLRRSRTMPVDHSCSGSYECRSGI